MGKHSAPEPKKISFLGSTGGIFAALALAGGIFAVSQVNSSPPEQKTSPPTERKIENGERLNPAKNVVATATALANLSSPTEVPSTSTGDTRVIVPVPVPSEPIQPPTQNPSPNPSPVKPDLDIQAEVDTPILGVDTDIEVRVPLPGQAVDTVDEVVERVTDPLKDLLGK